jgi:hypothetical protein
VVFVFHRPVLAADLRQPRIRHPAFLNAQDEVAGFLFGLAAVLGLIVTGDTYHLPRSREEAGVEVEPSDAQLAVFDAAMGGFYGRRPGGGEVIESFLGECVQGGLVVFKGEVKVGPGGGDGERRFFWQLWASPVMTAWVRTAAVCLRSRWLTGSSQSFFSPL